MSIDAFADFRMDGHNVIITGAAQNIGAQIAKTLSAAGAKVMVCDLQGEKCADTASDDRQGDRQRGPRHGLRRDQG
jgi:7-alpha-hydroxysteroid dehydrogenase